MAKVHQLDCSVNERNTGFGGCFLDWKIIKGMFLYDNPRSFTTAEIADLQGTLNADAINDIKADRMYPIGNFTTPTDSSEDVVVQTFGDGSKAIVRDGILDWTFQFTKGGYELLKSLRTHNNGAPYALFYDKNNNILGTTDEFGNFSAIPLQFFYAKPWKMSTGAAVSMYEVRVAFDANYANEDSDYVTAGFNLAQIKGLQDIHLVVNSWIPSTGALRAVFETEIGGTNLYDQYETDIVAAILEAINAETGGVITVTSVTPNASDKTFTVQLNHSDSDYPTSGNILLSFVVPSALADAGLVGFDGETLSLEVTGS